MKPQIIYENGYYFDKHSGSQYLWAHDEPARRRAARRGQVPMTFGQKLRRFLHNLHKEISTCHSSAVAYMYMTQHGFSPEEIKTYSDLGVKPWEPVIELGGVKNE